MDHILFQVDAFTNEPFKGNPAAVCLLEREANTQWMRAIAAEMNLSETAFVSPEGASYRLRWFTPTHEVDLCGHATLASAKVLFEQNLASQANPIHFKTLSGDLYAHWVDGDIELDFPSKRFRRISIGSKVNTALGFTPIEGVMSGNFYLFEAADEETIRKLEPNITALQALPMPEIIVTAKSFDPDFDFISRFFAPQLGIPEDPVTGSAHCLLATYWAEKLGKSTFRAFQASARGGVLNLKLEGDRVKIRGSAIIIFQGNLLV